MQILAESDADTVFMSVRNAFDQIVLKDANVVFVLGECSSRPINFISIALFYTVQYSDQLYKQNVLLILNPNYLPYCDFRIRPNRITSGHKAVTRFVLIEHCAQCAGGPGSGKGTQCERIVARWGFEHLSGGDLMRDEVASGSPQGNDLKRTMENGALVSLDVVLGIHIDAMVSANVRKGCKRFLLDGFPRDVEQAKRFEAEVRGGPLNPKHHLYQRARAT